MSVVLLSFASVAAVSLVSLVGLLTLSTDERRVRRLAELFVAFAVGVAILGTAVALVAGAAAREAVTSAAMRLLALVE